MRAFSNLDVNGGNKNFYGNKLQNTVRLTTIFQASMLPNIVVIAKSYDMWLSHLAFYSN